MFARSFRLMGRFHRRYPELSKVMLSRGGVTIASDRGMAPRALRDISAGQAGGRFADVRDPMLAVVVAGGALLGLYRLLDADPGRDDGEAADLVAEDLLRMFGVPAAQAREICARPLPELPGL
jgi:hypothetical protein